MNRTTNRTIKELKQGNHGLDTMLMHTTNRTIKELKQDDPQGAGSVITSTNRTIKELKHDFHAPFPCVNILPIAP